MFLLFALAGCHKQAKPEALPEAQSPAPGAQDPWCANKPAFGPVSLTAEQVAQRRGPPASLAAFIAAPYTVEVCGVQGELAALMSLRCEDGSQPYDSPQQAHASRTGSGDWPTRCGTPADHYVIPCPERSYEMVFDMYMCGPGESIF